MAILAVTDHFRRTVEAEDTDSAKTEEMELLSSDSLSVVDPDEIHRREEEAEAERIVDQILSVPPTREETVSAGMAVDAVDKEMAPTVVAGAECEADGVVNSGSAETSLAEDEQDKEWQRKFDMSQKIFRNLGSFDGSGDAEMFLVRLEAIAQTYEWSERDMLMSLVAALHGDAEQLLINCKGQLEYAQLAAKLRQRFSTRITPDQARIKLRNRKQQPSESLQELAADIQRLAALCAPQLSLEESDRWLGLPTFLEALTDNRLRLELDRRQFRTIDDALTEALYL
jgi:hypothetical protein